ncbi:MAG TPA: TolC family outer membrane protein [Rhizobacter sp.]|nr:TolC family outer membrane protein [Rhizobacter sp.]
MRFKTRALFVAATMACIASAQAQTNEVLKAAAQKAISVNPDVTARFNAYRAAADAVDAARGGYYPRLDLSAAVGKDRDTITSRTPENQSISRSGAALTLTQLLWDGLATKNEVGRLDHEKMARYFELLDTTETNALETTRAYYDVLRYRRLVQLAEDSYVQHKSAFNQIQSRFKAGVGRGVDLEQAGARLALAESNLSTELANLHDVSTRYQRIVGDEPPKNMPLPLAFKDGIAATASEASAEAVRRSAAVSATIESLRSARSLASVRESAYQPKIEARVRSGAGTNLEGVRDQRRNDTGEIVLNWNLFNGGSDAARVRQQANLVNQAADLRDRACRDARQLIAIAYNDTRKLNDQLLYLDRNTIAIEKARDAYRQQFDIGQRSLLDLLNSENELYTARRSYANAEYDLGIAYARTQAATQRLSAQLGLTRAENAPEVPAESEGWAAGEDGPARCPTLAIDMQEMDLQRLNQRAAAITPSPTAAPATATTAAPIGAVPAPAAPAAPGTPAAQTVRRLTDWAAAWEAKDVARYIGFYAPSFMPTTGDLATWKTKRRALVAKKGNISVKVEDIQTNTLAPNRVETSFNQSYRSDNFNDVSTKTLTWELINGQWYIVQESGR